MSYLLAVDIGNSNVTLALHNGDHWAVNYRISTDKSREADEYAALLLPLITEFGIKLSEIHTVVLGSVVPEATKHFGIFAACYLQAELIIADAKDIPAHILQIKTKQPELVGADRWLNVLAAKSFYFDGTKPIVVVDCGTAITFDVLDKQGDFIGGVITPGLSVLQTALKNRITSLPEPKFNQSCKVIGDCTQSALQSGLTGSFFGILKGILKDISDELGEEPVVVGTGGTINILESTKDIFQIRQGFLTLEGLRIFARIKRENAILPA